MLLIEITNMLFLSFFILISLKLCLSSCQNFFILVNNFFLSILEINVKNYTKMKKKSQDDM